MRAGASGVDWLEGYSVQRGLRALAERGLSLDVLTSPTELVRLPMILRKHPHLQIIVDHLAGAPIASGQLRQWQQDFREVASEPNAVAKVSGMLTAAICGDGTFADIEPFLQTALECFGPQRLMFGGDWPVSLLAASYANTVTATQRALKGYARRMLSTSGTRQLSVYIVWISINCHELYWSMFYRSNKAVRANRCDRYCAHE